jgi:hypothetical protein
MSQYAFFAYWKNIDPNMLETCINSLRMVNPAVCIVVVTDGVPDELDQRLTREYAVRWIRVPSERAHKRRATCKIEVLCDFSKQCNNNDEILVSDVDVYFITDPFTAFSSKPDIDLGLTTRGYEHLFPINGGIFFVRMNPEMRTWLGWHVKEIHKPTWQPYVQFRKKYHHERYGLDWSVGQDFLIANWEHRTEVGIGMGVGVVDVGPHYNYCPPTDTMGNGAFKLAWDALEKRSVSVLHLKSDLKKMIYDSNFPNAKINYPKGSAAWC